MSEDKPLITADILRKMMGDIEANACPEDAEAFRMRHYVGTDGKKHPLPRGMTLMDVAKAGLNQLAAQIVKGDPEEPPSER